MINIKKLLTGMVFCCLVQLSWGQTDFVWKAEKPITIACEADEEPVVHVALELLKRDCENVLSQTFVTAEQDGEIYVGTYGKSMLIDRLVKKSNLDVSILENHAEAFLINVMPDGKLLIAGSDKRGTAYGIIELTRMLGVSPWEWWADATPKKRNELRIEAGFKKTDYPRVPYRGIFINDEDWGMTPWSCTNYEPTGVKGQIGPKTHARIFELLLRLRANTFWPAMHECSVPFFFTNGNKEIADKYAIYLGTSHCEPMMRNTNGEWHREGKGEYNYLTNRKNVLRFWEERVKQLQNSDDIYTLGMRGIHDGAMQGAKSVEEQKAALTAIIKDQRDLLAKYKGDVTRVPQVFIPYKEVLDAYDAGLKVPEDVTLMWCDDNYGYITHFPSPEEAARPGGNGIYYHVSYWGRPHDYLWLSTASPYLIYQQMKLAYDQGIRKMWILNVGDIKPAEYQIELFMDMAWNIDQVAQQGVTSHLHSFLSREFGNTAAAYLLPMMQEHYRLAYIHKPEFMGNTRAEEYSPKYEVVSDLPWSESYIRRRLADYQNLETKATACEHIIDPDKRQAYFQLVQYSLQGAAEMNKKCLYAQLARHGKAGWEESDAAFDSIVSLTARYNANPKWSGIMSYEPRFLPVFKRVPHTQATTPLKKEERAHIYKWNALETVAGRPVVCEGLGYEGMACGIAKGETLAFDFASCTADSIEVQLCLLPNHPVVGNELRVIVEMDGLASDTLSYRTEGRREECKQNVLYNQAVRHAIFPLDANRPVHRIRVKALDEGVVLDRVYVYKKE